MKSSHLTASERSTLGRPVAGYPGTAVMVGRFFLAFVAAVVVAAMNPSSGLADTIQAGGYNDYGHLANAGPRCASTATINSFQFLMNKYPEIRKTNLIPGAGTDLASARDALHDGWKNKNGEQRAGVKPECGQAGFGKHRQFWWDAKAHWVDDFAPGEIALRGMVFTDGLDQPDPTKWVSGDKLVRGAPTWNFLWKQVRDGEDVEIAFADKNKDPSSDHAVTLVGLSDDGGTRQITYLDPNNPDRDPNDPSKPGLFTAPVAPSDLFGESLKFTWNNKVNDSTDVSIYLAYSESPVPEPSTFLLFVLGLAGISFCRKSAGRWRGVSANRLPSHPAAGRTPM